ncbi:hypothetical protein Tco_0277691 [Tanacetum coccineum]
MRTRSQSRNSNRQQEQVNPTIVEPFNLVEPIENQAPPVVTMDDNRTMAQMLKAPTMGYEDAIVVPEITADKFELKHGLGQRNKEDEFDNSSSPTLLVIALLIAMDGWTGWNADIKDGASVNIMGEPLSSDRVFEFPINELEPHPAYDFFAPGPLPGYASGLNNNNGCLEMDDYLLGELEAMVAELMVIPAIKEVVEPVAKVEEEQVIAPVVDIEEEQMDAPVMDMEEDLAVLFGDDNFEDDASDGFDKEED